MTTTTTPAPSTALQRAGGLAAHYIVLADLAAIAYVVLPVDYPAATEQAANVALHAEHHTSLYLMHLVSFELVALGLIVMTIATYYQQSESGDRGLGCALTSALESRRPSAARLP